MASLKIIRGAGAKTLGMEGVALGDPLAVAPCAAGVARWADRDGLYMLPDPKKNRIAAVGDKSIGTSCVHVKRSPHGGRAAQPYCVQWNEKLPAQHPCWVIQQIHICLLLVFSSATVCMHSVSGGCNAWLRCGSSRKGNSMHIQAMAMVETVSNVNINHDYRLSVISKEFESIYCWSVVFWGRCVSGH